MLYLLINLTLLFVVFSQCSTLRPDLFMKLIDLITSDIMRDKLHWLRADKRVDFKLCLLVYKAVHSLMPDNITGMCLPVCSVKAHWRLRSSAAGNLIMPTTNIQFGQQHLQKLLSSLETIHQSISGRQHLSLLSKKLSKLIYLLNHIIICFSCILFLLEVGHYVKATLWWLFHVTALKLATLFCIIIFMIVCFTVVFLQLFQYLALLRDNINKPQRALCVLWAIGQAGLSNLGNGLKGWLTTVDIWILHPITQ